MSDQKNDENALSVQSVQFAVWKRRKFILLVTICGILIGIIVSLINTTISNSKIQYRVSAAVAINSENGHGTYYNNKENPSYQEIYLAQNMADSIIYVAKSEKVLSKVIENCGFINTVPNNIRSNLVVKQYKESQIITISLIWNDKESGVAILQEIINILPETLVDTLKLGSVKVVDEPTTAVAVVKTGNLKILVIVTALFMLAGVSIAVVEILMHPTFLDSKSIKRSLKLEMIGEIPEDQYVRAIPAGELTQNRDKYLSIQFKESIASATHIMKNILEQSDKKVVLFTSTYDEEGKTTLVTNIAVQLSQLGKRVLVVDGDLKKPSLAKVFLSMEEYEKNLPSMNQLNDQAVIKLTNTLAVLPCLLEKEVLAMDLHRIEFIRELSKMYDFVLFDTSAIGLSADAFSLRELDAQAVFIIRQNDAQIAIIEDSLNRLEKSGVNVIGYIFNDIYTKIPGNYYNNRFNTKVNKIKARQTLKLNFKNILK